MEFLIFLILAAAAFAIWRVIRRAYLAAQMRHLTRAGDPMIMDFHAHHMRTDWYSLDPALRVSMAIDFQKDPGRVYAVFKSGGSDLQRADFDRIMRGLIASDPDCAHVAWRGDPS
jgi:hypothetical protein